MKRFWQSQHRPLLLVLLIAVLIWPASLVGPFQFDDWNVIVEQPAVHSLQAWWHSLPGIRPLLKLSYALNWIASADAWGFHCVNLLIHAINIGLVWLLLGHWPNLNQQARAWALLVFALHPLQTEAVTYISGRSVSLMVMFCLLSLLCCLHAQTPRRWLAAAFFLLALAVRETALPLPFVLFVWLCLGGMPWRQAVRELTPLWLVLIGVAVLGGLVYRPMLESALATRGPLENLALQVDALRYLLTEPLLLLRNNIDPDLAQRAGYDAAWWASLLCLTIALIAAWRMRQQRPDVSLAIAWFLLWLLPTSSVLARLDPVAERHLYLALLGPAVLVVAGVQALLSQRLSARVAIVVLAVPGVCMVLAMQSRIADYRSESKLWEATVQRSPEKARVWNNLGHAYLVEDRPDLAIPALQRALVLDPNLMRAEINLERAEAAAGSSQP